MNIAVGATTTLYWSKSRKLIEREMPTTIIMCLGTNDIADIHRTGEGAAQGGDEYDACMQGVIEMFHEVVPDAKIYWLGAFQYGETNRWNKREEISTCNRLMREYCADKDWVDFIDCEYAFYDDDDYTQKPNADYFVSDYLHLSRKGYKVMTTIIREAIGLEPLAA